MTEQNQRPYKILALDGGGFKGVMTAQILLKVEEEIRKQHNCELHEYFDLVTGTSTGSLLAAGIALGKTADELLSLYKDKGEMIFPKAKRRGRKLRFLRGFIPYLSSTGLYDNDKKGLGEALRTTEGYLTPISQIPDGRPVLLIPAYNLSNRRIDWFCSNNPQHPPHKPAWYDSIPVWKICACSSAAPTFFPPFQLTNEGQPKTISYPYIDGGVAVNNPALLGIAHALFLPYQDAVEHPPNFKLDDMAVLSIGTGDAIQPYTYKTVKNWGNLQWAERLADLFIPAPNDVTADVCWQIIRQESYQNSRRFLRLGYAVPSKKQYQDTADYDSLKEISSIHQAFEKDTFGTIDNPELFDAYRAFAQCYLDGHLRKKELKTPKGLGRDQGDLSNEAWVAKSITPSDAIADFVAHNQYPTHRPNAPQGT